MSITHAKTVAIADWTQADLNEQIALGNYPYGTVLADIALPSDFNADHTITLTKAELNTAVSDGDVAFLDSANVFTKPQNVTPVALSVSSNLVAVDMSLSNNFSLTLQATTGQTLSNPTNTTNGQKGTIYITQNGTPSTLAYGTNWYEETTGVAPSVSTTASAQNSLHYSVFDSTHVYYVLNKHGVA